MAQHRVLKSFSGRCSLIELITRSLLRIFIRRLSIFLVSFSNYQSSEVEGQTPSYGKDRLESSRFESESRTSFFSIECKML